MELATRDEVAQLAGVSASVVSYVVNNGPRKVSPSTKQKVLEAIEKLNYRPNSIARALRVKKTLALGLIVPDSSNPFFAALVQSIEDIAYENGYTLLIGNASNDQEREIDYIRAFSERQVDGLLLVSSVSTTRSLEQLQKLDLPFVIVDRLVDDKLSVSTVVADNETGGYLATEHLLWHGHKNIACLAGPSDLTPSADRYRGWQKAMEKAGLEASPNLLIRSEFSSLQGYFAVKKLLETNGSITALFVSTDSQAIGALRAVIETGLDIPRDFAIVSFDNISQAAFTCPPLSTINQPIEQMGKVSIEMLLESMQNPKANFSKQVLPVELSIRRSCGCKYAI